MEITEKKRAVALGVRIILVFLATLFLLVFVAYHLLSDNVQAFLAEYTTKLVQSMVEQGVTTVEQELQANREEVAVLAGAFSIPVDGAQTPVFPVGYPRQGVLRLVYVSPEGTAASDGRQRDVRERRDIVSAFEGKTAVFGPYYNEEDEYVICFSSPVFENGAVVGVVSLEKDGYRLCELIQSIRFIDSGESYLIDQEGTDIAVSEKEHIDWVYSRYNARRILEEQEDPVTRSVAELEQNGLDGETGIGTYEWDGSECYLAYAPIPSTGWVLLAGLREEELSSMTQDALHASVVRGPVLGLCIVVFFLLAVLIIFWIISSMKKNIEINERLNILANHDALTGLQNRASFQAALDTITERETHSLACIYIDVNGLHEINNYLGHQAGDEMLKTVADTLRQVFTKGDIYRIGGDEFVVLCHNQNIDQDVELVRNELRRHSYEISIGVACRYQGLSIKSIVSLAEEAMQQNKQQFYRENGKERQMRNLNRKLEQLVIEKEDADAFLSVLASEYKGVYFVNMGDDTIRHLYVPPYFEEILSEAGSVFSEALLLYAQRIVMPQYQQGFIDFCRYDRVERQLTENTSLDYVYQKLDTSWIKLRIMRFKTYETKSKDTLWIFESIEPSV